MTKKIFTLVFTLGLFFQGNSQDEATLAIQSQSKDMWEIGGAVGASYLSGDNNAFGFGINGHIRKAIDHTFSLRGTVDFNTYGVSDGNPDARIGGSGDISSTLIAGNVDLLVALNQFKAGRNPKVSPYFLVGAGASQTDVEDDNDGQFTYTSGTSYQANVGGGIGFKLSDRISLYLEHKSSFLFGGEQADALDGFIWETTTSRSPNSDVIHFTGVRIGINLGKTESKALPLWWNSPIDLITEDLAEVKGRPILDLTDTDGDGVIDMVDKEVESPANAIVDSRGVAMDSDGDGILDHEDKEPFSQPGYKVDSKGVAQIPDPGYLNEDDVNKIVDAKIAAIDFPDPSMEWFLPMINFADNSYRIKDAEIQKLYHVATVLKQNPALRVVAKGYTDKRASDCYNELLSYNRAQAAVDYMVANFGVSRDRLVLTYGGETNTLVPTEGSNLSNRRVEFHIAKGENEMGRPSCGVNKAGVGPSYNGNKSGY